MKKSRHMINSDKPNELSEIISEKDKKFTDYTKLLQPRTINISEEEFLKTCYSITNLSSFISWWEKNSQPNGTVNEITRLRVAKAILRTHPNRIDIHDEKIIEIVKSTILKHYWKGFYKKLAGYVTFDDEHSDKEENLEHSYRSFDKKRRFIEEKFITTKVIEKYFNDLVSKKEKGDPFISLSKLVVNDALSKLQRANSFAN